MVITGATSGLGLEVLKMLLNYRDVRILAVGRNLDELPLDKRVFPLSCDVSSQEGVDKVFEEAVSKLGGIDFFWANAGYGCYQKFGEPDWKQAEQIFQTNVLSPFYSLEKLLSLEGDHDKHFAVTDSIVGQLEVPGYALYVATKHAIHGGMKAIQYEQPKHLKISIIYPIATRTRFFDRAGTSIGQSGPVQSAEACSRAIIRGIERDRKKIYPYPIWPIVHFIFAVVPFVKHATLRVLNKELQAMGGKK